MNAFSSIPAAPTPVEEFLRTHNISLAVLRQSKRFDQTNLGPVKVRKVDGRLMVWRETEGASNDALDVDQAEDQTEALEA